MFFFHLSFLFVGVEVAGLPKTPAGNCCWGPIVDFLRLPLAERARIVAKRDPLPPVPYEVNVDWLEPTGKDPPHIELAEFALSECIDRIEGDERGAMTLKRG